MLRICRQYAPPRHPAGRGDRLPARGAAGPRPDRGDQRSTATSAVNMTALTFIDGSCARDDRGRGPRPGRVPDGGAALPPAASKRRSCCSAAGRHGRRQPGESAMTDRARMEGGRDGGRARRPRTASPRRWIRPSTVTRCTCAAPPRWRRTARRAGLSEGRTRDLVLAVHELAANSGAPRRRAGPAGGCGSRPTGCAARSATTVLTGMAPARRRRMRRCGSVEPGHGLWLVRRIADGGQRPVGPSGTVAAVTFRSGRARAAGAVPAVGGAPRAAAPSWPSPASWTLGPRASSAARSAN